MELVLTIALPIVVACAVAFGVWVKDRDTRFEIYILVLLLIGLFCAYKVAEQECEEKDKAVAEFAVEYFDNVDRLKNVDTQLDDTMDVNTSVIYAGPVVYEGHVTFTRGVVFKKGFSIDDGNGNITWRSSTD